MVDRERLSDAMVAAMRRRTLAVAGAEVFEVDGVLLLLTGLPDPSLNHCVVERQPADAVAALKEAEARFAERDLQFGIRLEVGRHPSVDDAVRARGLRRLFRRPIMTVPLGELPALAPPWEVEIVRVHAAADLAVLAAIEVEAFGTPPAAAEGLLGRGLAELPDAALLLARLDGESVGEAFGIRQDDTVGVFGVGVVPRARMRGIGGALTVEAARAVGLPEDTAWLFPSDLAQPLYERLGFRSVLEEEVWIREA